ncbi:hypothetical protein CONLIGDRAFT_299927 [Coniochaeta ligniaria NRRL 30616]|uniref:Uncharacterized protein n=1 Tax=Coniochaeta ligniaria NRRL 30616 TaxID=1408157 RepID=A0A1J7ITU1_9PEZI|nr:hypothetical protein CONLIGDRAFT_299927 [Coniochaeta ligniaria NRRL 30616]
MLSSSRLHMSFRLPAAHLAPFTHRSTQRLTVNVDCLLSPNEGPGVSLTPLILWPGADFDWVTLGESRPITLSPTKAIPHRASSSRIVGGSLRELIRDTAGYRCWTVQGERPSEGPWRICWTLSQSQTPFASSKLTGRNGGDRLPKRGWGKCDVSCETSACHSFSVTVTCCRAWTCPFPRPFFGANGSRSIGPRTIDAGTSVDSDRSLSRQAGSWKEAPDAWSCQA